MSEFHVGTRLEPTPICVMYPSGPVWGLEVENLVARGEHQFELACAVASPVRRRAVLIIVVLTTRVGIIEGDRGFEQNCGTG